MDRARPRVVAIDDHPAIAASLAGLAPEVDVVGTFPTVEGMLRAPTIATDSCYWTCSSARALQATLGR